MITYRPESRAAQDGNRCRRLATGRRWDWRGPAAVSDQIRFPFRSGNLGGGKEMVANEFGIGRHGKRLRGLPYKAYSAPQQSQEFSGRSARAAVNHARA